MVLERAIRVNSFVYAIAVRGQPEQVELHFSLNELAVPKQAVPTQVPRPDIAGMGAWCLAWCYSATRVLMTSRYGTRNHWSIS
jgi:hypothetical protein